MMSENEEQSKPVTRFTVTMNGASDWSVAKYGVVEFLRVHPFWRSAVAILGVGCVLAIVVSWSGLLKLPRSVSEYSTVNR
jgi:hypothetical protein